MVKSQVDGVNDQGTPIHQGFHASPRAAMPLSRQPFTIGFVKSATEVTVS
jgi:hypothetical protein